MTQYTDDNSITVTAGESISQGNAVYIKTSDGKAYKAKAESGKYPAVGLVTNTSAEDDDVLICTAGTFDASSGLSAGKTYFLSDTTAGALTTDRPAIRQQIGMAKSATEISISLSDDTPEYDYASYQEVTYTSQMVSNITWWTDSEKTIKIREIDLTRDSYNRVTQQDIKMYESGELVKTVRYTYTYSSGRIQSITTAVI